jgi:hypothetical protein
VRGIQQEQQRPFRNLQQRKKFLHASSALQSSEFFKINEREKKKKASEDVFRPLRKTSQL